MQGYEMRYKRRVKYSRCSSWNWIAHLYGLSLFETGWLDYQLDERPLATLLNDLLLFSPQQSIKIELLEVFVER